MSDLDLLGWDAGWAAAFTALPEADLLAARVVFEHGRFYEVSTGAATISAVSAGSLRHAAATSAALPTTGDFVALRPAQASSGKLATIRHVLPRRSRFSRRAAGKNDVEQVVAANVDTVFLMMGHDGDFNLRRIERYLAMAFASGARPIVVLNKADLASDLVARVASVNASAAAMPVLSTDLTLPDGARPLWPFIEPRKTIALLGSSGVGKSTLLNLLAGSDVARTGATDARTGRGRHTTTRAQLFALPGGALVIDTPGLRELQLWDADEGVDAAFPDVAVHASACRFSDCRHRDEPDCAVRAAVAAGVLTADRYDSWHKLHTELAAARPRRGPRR